MGDVLAESSKRVETLLDRFSAFPASTGALPDAQELVRIVASLHGECLRRMVQTLREELGERADALLERCCDDPVVGSLFVTHGVHPVPLEERLRRAIASVQSRLQSSANHAELVRADEDCVTVRIDGPPEVTAIVERAIREAAPEVLEVRAVGQTISLLDVS